jgi:hypothetical protein
LLRDDIFADFYIAKYGDEYLCSYIAFQKDVRKWYKIITIIFSVGGIGTAFGGQNIISAIIFFLIGIVQLLSSIEVYVIHSEKQIESLHKLRMMYYDRSNDLEKLFKVSHKITENEAECRFYELRDACRKIEELDLEINVKKIKKLKKKAQVELDKYINTYYARG